jgi:hypothetical protein
MTSPVTDTLYSIWAVTEKNVYVAGDNGALLHYDGNAWAALVGPPGTPPPRLAGIWADDVGDLAAVSSTSVYTFGGQWQASTTTYFLESIWADNVSDVFVSDSHGEVGHYNGSGWSWSTPGSDTAVQRQVWGVGPGNVFVTSSDKNLFHGDGTTWQIACTAANPLAGMWADSASDAYMIETQGASSVIAYYAGSSTCTEVQTFGRLDGVWGSGSGDVFFVGENGVVVHGSGMSWDTTAPRPTVTSTLEAVGGTGPDDVYAVGDGGTIWHYTGIAH